MKKTLLVSVGLLTTSLLAGCATHDAAFEQLEGSYRDNVDGYLVSHLGDDQVFVGYKSFSFGATPDVVYPEVEGHHLIRARFIYKGETPSVFTHSYATGDKKRKVIDAQRRILGDCVEDCIYEEIIWVSVPKAYVSKYTSTGFRMYFLAENGKKEVLDISGHQAIRLKSSAWNTRD